MQHPATRFGKASSSHPLEHPLPHTTSKKHVQIIGFSLTALFTAGVTALGMTSSVEGTLWGEKLADTSVSTEHGIGPLQGFFVMCVNLLSTAILFMWLYVNKAF